MYLDTCPTPLRPLDNDGQPLGRTVEAFQLRPDLVDAFLAWTGGTRLMLNGGPVVLLPGDAPADTRLVGLGDFAVRDGDQLRAEPALGFAQRYTAT